MAKHVAHFILKFFRVYGCPIEFKLSDLVRYVGEQCAKYPSPDSTSRNLRLLRQHGYIEYEVVNRAQSHYRLTVLREDPTPKEPKARPQVLLTGSPYEALLVDLPPKLLRKVYRMIVFEMHPDRGGDAAIVAKVNAAWEKIGS